MSLIRMLWIRLHRAKVTPDKLQSTSPPEGLSEGLGGQTYHVCPKCQKNFVEFDTAIYYDTDPPRTYKACPFCHHRILEEGGRSLPPPVPVPPKVVEHKQWSRRGNEDTCKCGKVLTPENVIKMRQGKITYYYCPQCRSLLEDYLIA